MIALSIFILAFFIRIYKLALFPLNHDEAMWYLGCLNNFDKFMGIPVSCFHGYTQPFYSYLVFFVKKVFFSPEHIVRIPSVFIGSATVILVYKLAKDMYGKTAGLISSALLSFLPWHTIQSRIGLSLILTPFFGCLIFLVLFRAINKKSNLLFITAYLFLSLGSFYTYQASLLFIPIYLVTLFCLSKKLSWLKPKIILMGLLIFLIILSPLIYLQITDRIPQYLGKVYRLYYQDGPFEDTMGRFLAKSIRNLRTNSGVAFETLFFSSGGRMLNGAALKAPLLIHWLSFLLILFSIILSLYHKEVSDKIMLSWLSLGYLGGLMGVRFFQPRYIIIILIPALILLAKAIAVFFKFRTLFFIGILLCTSLIFIEISQLVNYFLVAPTHLEECRKNSYGSKEAAKYLSQIPDINNYQIIADFRMRAPLFTYLNYFNQNKIAYIKHKKIRENGIYYCLWAPESHPEDYWEGNFSRLWKYFAAKYPKATALKTIYYPNGIAAIYIFKVDS